jgi:hypothetical protein
MFHTFRGSPGSSRGNLLRVLLATGNSTSPPTATSSLYHKPTERNKRRGTSTGAHKKILTPDNSIKNTINKVQCSSIHSYLARNKNQNIHLRERPAMRIGRSSGVGGGGQVHLSALLPVTATTQMPSRRRCKKYTLLKSTPTQAIYLTNLSTSKMKLFLLN